MGSAKHHHFVPQFYLRRFSNDGRSISTLHKASGKIIERASIKGQCAVDNFHGWHPGAESSLSTIEGACAVTLDKIIRERRLPERGTNDFGHLLLFVALQSARTTAAAEANDKLTDHFYKMLAKGRPEFNGIDFDRFSIQNTYPIALPISTALEAHHFLASLQFALLEPGGTREFPTSDNPVVLYNSALADVWWQGVTGLDSEGLQVFLPLGPDVCLYMYDDKVYSKPSNTGLRVLSYEDYLKIACLCILNSNRNVYARRVGELELVANLRRLTQSLEGYDRVAIAETEAVPNPDGTSGALVVNYRLHPPAQFAFRFARQKGTVDEAGIRSDRQAKSRRAALLKSVGGGAGAKSAAVKTATIEQPRELLSEFAVHQFAREISH